MRPRPDHRDVSACVELAQECLEPRRGHHQRPGCIRLLRLSGTDTTGWPYRRRRAALESVFTARRLSAPWALCPSTTEAGIAREWLTGHRPEWRAWSSRDWTTPIGLGAGLAGAGSRARGVERLPSRSGTRHGRLVWAGRREGRRRVGDPMRGRATEARGRPAGATPRTATAPGTPGRTRRPGSMPSRSAGGTARGGCRRERRGPAVPVRPGRRAASATRRGASACPAAATHWGLQCHRSLAPNGAPHGAIGSDGGTPAPSASSSAQDSVSVHAIPHRRHLQLHIIPQLVAAGDGPPDC